MKCILVGEDTVLEERIRTFLFDKSTEMVAGKRRIGRQTLNNLVLKIASEEGIKGSYTEDAPPDAELILIEDLEKVDLGLISETWPYSDILYSQVLCHQVPAVARVRR